MIRKCVWVMAVAVFVASVLFSASCAAQPGGAEDMIKMKRDILISRDMTVKDVVVIYGSATVYGTVEGSLVVVFGSANLRTGSRIAGDVVVVGGELVREDGASISGKVAQVSVPRFLPSVVAFLRGGGWGVLAVAIGMLALIGFLALAVLLVAFLPRHIAAMVSVLDHSFAGMFLWGVLASILIVPLALLLFISIIGIILIPLEILLVIIAFIAGYVVSAVYVGRRIFRSFKKSLPPFVDAIAGIVVLSAVGLIPFLGTCLKLIFLAAGFGAVIMTKFGTSSRISLDKG